MHNYIDKWTCIAMMNKNCSLLADDVLGFNKTKDGSKVAVFSKDYKFDAAKHKHVSWLYLDEEPKKEDFDSIYCLEEIVSKIDAKNWFWKEKEKPSYALAGKSFIEWRGTINKWSKIQDEGHLVIEKLSKSNFEQTIDMIEKWRYLDNGGMKYGWQERAGCDKALVKRYVEDFEGIQGHVLGQVFKLDNEVVGYSCVETRSQAIVDGLPEFKYLTRKVLSTEGRRNITEYIDYKTIESIYEANQAILAFLVNWGASSGGVHWYKTHKFPLYDVEKKWFASRKAKKDEI